MNCKIDLGNGTENWEIYILTPVEYKFILSCASLWKVLIKSYFSGKLGRITIYIFSHYNRLQMLNGVMYGTGQMLHVICVFHTVIKLY